MNKFYYVSVSKDFLKSWHTTRWFDSLEEAESFINQQDPLFYYKVDILYG